MKSDSHSRPTIVALVPSKDAGATIAETVTALASIDRLDRLVVIDDGSTDDTTQAALDAGAEVVRIGTNRGKGGAIAAGVEATPEADIYLLIDADVVRTASAADALLAPLLADEADLAVGVFPPAAGRGGSGRIKAFAKRAIKRATGVDVAEPLSGQRAVRRELLSGLIDADRFGLEVAMTIDSIRTGARFVEVPVDMDHDHTGGSWRGVLHRARQGWDICRALFPRLTSERQRLIGLAAVFLLLVLGAVWRSNQFEPRSQAVTKRPSKVVVFAINPLGFKDLDRPESANLRAAVARGSLAAMSVRTASHRPSLAEGYASLGAGYRVKASSETGVAYPSDFQLGTVTAEQLLKSRGGVTPDGEISVVGATRLLDANSSALYRSKPGALGDELREAGLRTAVVGNSDEPGVGNDPTVISRPAALAVMDSDLSVSSGVIDRSLLVDDSTAPFGVISSPKMMMGAIVDQAAKSDVMFVDSGDLARASAYGAVASRAAAEAARTRALASTDALLGNVLDWAEGEGDVTVMIVSVAASSSSFRLAPLVMVGPGIPEGYIVSPSTKRAGLAAVTDLGPTILDQMSLPVPDSMAGRALRYEPAKVDMARLRRFDNGTSLRETTYYPTAVWYIIFQAVICLSGAFLLSRFNAHPRRGTRLLRFMALFAASFPVATFLAVLVPGWATFSPGSAYLVEAFLAAAVAGFASRARRRPLSPLGWILGFTLAVVSIDVVNGTWLHVNSWLGYSLHSAGRFYGIPNTTFSVMAACGVLLGAIVVHYSAHRREALILAGLMLAGLVIIDGAPMMGGDVGGILTFVPLFALLMLSLSGRKLNLNVAALAVAGTCLVLSLATAVDLSRPPQDRTHLGRFASDVAKHGLSTFTDTFLRKQNANLRILQVSIWTWMVPIVAAFLFYVLVVERQWASLLPSGSALRAGAVAVVGGSLLGFITNDSGPVVIGLFFAYLGPFLIMVALDSKWLRPQLLIPDRLAVSVKSSEVL